MPTMLLTPTCSLPPASPDLWVNSDSSHAIHHQPGGFTCSECPGLCPDTSLGVGHVGLLPQLSPWPQAGSSRDLSCFVPLPLNHVSPHPYGLLSSVHPDPTRRKQEPRPQFPSPRASTQALGRTGSVHICGESHSLEDFCLMLFFPLNSRSLFLLGMAAKGLREVG